MLLCIEHPPIVKKRVGFPRAENAACRRITVGDVEAGNLIVPIILKSATRDRAEARVKCS